MPELKVDPRKDALLGPAMRRTAEKIKQHLAFYVEKRITVKALSARLEFILIQILTIAVERGYDLAIKEGKLTPLSLELASLKMTAKRRAVLATKFIIKTTKKALDVEAAIGKKNVASKERADDIVQNEAPRMFFMGMRKAWSRITGSRMPTKRWFTTNDNSCELCESNEDEGSIPVDEPFGSGDLEPPIHINCECLLGLYV